MAAIETLGDLKRHGMGLYAHCNAPNAGHGSRLDLDDLIAQFGEGYVFINDKRIGRQARCGLCKYLGATITVIAART